LYGILVVDVLWGLVVMGTATIAMGQLCLGLRMSSLRSDEGSVKQHHKYAKSRSRVQVEGCPPQLDRRLEA
jgi:hypothetical protein